MTSEIFPVVIGALFVLVLIWFALVGWLFRRLEDRHASKYEEMGRPSLILRNHLEGNIALMKFLFLRQHTKLGDGALSKFSDAILVLFVIYTVLFLALFVSVASGVAAGTP